MTTDQMTAHLEALAADHGVTLEWAGSSGRAWRRIRRVRTPVIKSDVTYAIALHEFGHVLGEQSGRRVDREVQAWKWARVNARVWTDRMDRTRGHRLGTYVRWAERRQRRSHKVYIPADHIIYGLAD